eukprot:scaffold1124_cov270-Chaetoceros_neogracile.AAC.32
MPAGAGGCSSERDSSWSFRGYNGCGRYLCLMRFNDETTIVASKRKSQATRSELFSLLLSVVVNTIDNPKTFWSS